MAAVRGCVGILDVAAAKAFVVRSARDAVAAVGQSAFAAAKGFVVGSAQVKIAAKVVVASVESAASIAVESVTADHQACPDAPSL